MQAPTERTVHADTKQEPNQKHTRCQQTVRDSLRRRWPSSGALFGMPRMRGMYSTLDPESDGGQWWPFTACVLPMAYFATMPGATYSLAPHVPMVLA